MIRDSEAETHFDAAALDGRSLSQVFNDFIFEDPEVKRLGEIAVAKCPAFSRVLRGGAFYMYGVDAWPLGKNHTADLCSSERGPVGWLADPDPPELTKARLAIQKRFHEILRLLRGGELSAWGINAKTRQREQIPTAIFSHRRFWLKTNEFDLYYLSTADPDNLFDLQEAWVAVTVERPTTGGTTNKLTLREPKTRGEASIAAAVRALYSEGIPPGKSVQIRDDEIRAYQKANRLMIMTPKSIQRYLG